MGCGSSKSTQTSSKPAKEEQTQHTVVEESGINTYLLRALQTIFSNLGNSAISRKKWEFVRFLKNI